MGDKQVKMGVIVGIWVLFFFGKDEDFYFRGR